MVLIQMLAEEFGNLGSSTFRMKNTFFFFLSSWHSLAFYGMNIYILRVYTLLYCQVLVTQMGPSMF